MNFSEISAVPYKFVANVVLTTSPSKASPLKDIPALLTNTST
jgi:hypothetical protein